MRTNKVDLRLRGSNNFRNTFTKIRINARFTTRSGTIGCSRKKDLIFYHVCSDARMVYDFAVISTYSMYFQIFCFSLYVP